jgi:hypothetical protein
VAGSGCSASAKTTKQHQPEAMIVLRGFQNLEQPAAEEANKQSPAEVLPLEPAKNLRKKSVKPCPFCLEEIREGAVKCRHCGEYVAGRRARWNDFIAFFEGLSIDERVEMLEESTEEQREIITKVVYGKDKIPRRKKPTRLRIFARRLKSNRRFTRLAWASAFLLLGWLVINSGLVSLSLDPFRSRQFDVPLPRASSSIKPNLRSPDTGSVAREDYATTLSAQELFSFYDSAMAKEGWKRLGDPVNGKALYRSGKRWMMLWVQNTSGSFVLMGEPALKAWILNLPNKMASYTGVSQEDLQALYQQVRNFFGKSTTSAQNSARSKQ